MERSYKIQSILKKHAEWETRVWFEGDHPARDI